MGVKIHQGRVACKVVIRGVNAKVRIGNGRAGHIQRVDNLLEVRGRTIRGDLISKNGEGVDGEEKQNALPIKPKRSMNHMTNDQVT